MKMAEVLQNRGMGNRGVITLWKTHTQTTLTPNGSAQKSELDTSVPMSKDKMNKYPKMQPMQSRKCTWEDCVKERKYWLESYQ